MNMKKTMVIIFAITITMFSCGTNSVQNTDNDTTQVDTNAVMEMLMDTNDVNSLSETEVTE
jgi:hypothetical protein